ncbi:MAG: hypothetical protein HYX26_09730 [Acidobacteriales bacterium]|nr:hypothetical protein [Terriglobales bacterium]
MTDRRKSHRDGPGKRRNAPRPHTVLKQIEDATYSILRNGPEKEKKESEPKPHPEHKHKPHKH